MKIAFVTGGGDCAGINSALARAVLHGAGQYGDTFVGIQKAFEGLAADDISAYAVDLTPQKALEFFDAPSTILGSSRFAPYNNASSGAAADKIKENLKKIGVDAIMATGGNDTVLSALGAHESGVQVIAVPKSIDNDISGTDWMLGAHTAIDAAARAFKSASVSAKTHSRISINEVMGRKAGWLAFFSGTASGADFILVPEKTFQLQSLIQDVKQRFDQQGYVNIVASEGMNINPNDPVYKQAVSDNADDLVLKAMLTEKPETDPHGNIKLGGIGMILQRILVGGMNVKMSLVRQSNVGFTLRGLHPNAYDVNLGQRFGRKAVELLHAGESGYMVGVHGMNIRTVPMKEALPQFTLNAMDEDELVSLGVYF
ncbi:MAG: 6-phosphofructokinase [candidate division KSB1 bacterium]|nr:6-phosphofructokinase [candidate division KSB1 bacterium]